jgi:hypothetical protein
LAYERLREAPDADFELVVGRGEGDARPADACGAEAFARSDRDAMLGEKRLCCDALGKVEPDVRRS